jgi:hypothetical protein
VTVRLQEGCGVFEAIGPRTRVKQAEARPPTRFSAGAAAKAAVFLSVALLAGCGSSGGDGADSSGPAASPDAYRQALAGAGKPVAAALAGTANAKTLKALATRLDDAEQAAGQAAEQLGATTPPEDVRAEHSELVQGFKQLNADLGGLRDAVEGRELCTASVVMARLGKADGLVAVRDASKALAAKGGGQGYKVSLVVPLPPQGQPGRPSNGQFVRQGSRTGRGELTIDNGGGRDAVITLAVGKRPAFAVYVRKGAKHTVTGIRDGTYHVFFTSGTDWDLKARAFGRGCSFDRFDDSMKFETTQTATQTEWSTWTITLQPVVGGNAPTSEVDPDDFPVS